MSAAAPFEVLRAVVCMFDSEEDREGFHGIRPFSRALLRHQGHQAERLICAFLAPVRVKLGCPKGLSRHAGGASQVHEQVLTVRGNLRAAALEFNHLR